MKINKVAVCIIVLFISVVFDLKSYVVPNFLVLFGIFYGIFISMLDHGLLSLFNVGTNILVIILIFLPLFILHMIGAGDIKLILVICSIMGLNFTFKFTFASFLYGAVLSIIKMIYLKNFRSRIKYLADYLSSLKSKEIIPYYDLHKDGRECVIHFTIPILLSFITVCIKEGIL